VGLASIVIKRVDAATADFAGLASVTSNIVLGRLVPLLVDVELAITGPVCAQHPVGRPGAAHGLGEVVELGDEKTRVVPLGALETDRSTTPDVLAGRVNTNVHLVLVGPDQAGLLGRRLALVVDEAMVGIDIKAVASIKPALFS